MKRRQFIGIATVGAAGAVLPAKAQGEERLIAALARPRLRQIMAGDAVVAGLGRLYRERMPAEHDVATLTRLITNGLELPRDGTELHSSLALKVDDQVQRDFAEGRTVLLEGWILSVTEARQCALFSLVAG